jgi:hypothetical protein
MHISVKWFNDQFNVNLHAKAGVTEFLSIKGCRIKEHNGKEFLAFPSTKGNNDKWWNHAWGSEDFQAHVIGIAKAGKPQEQKPAAKDPGGFETMKDDIPF